MTTRSVLITGGTGMIGAAIVRALSSWHPAQKNVENWEVIANYFHDDERAIALSRDAGAKLQRANIGDETQVEAMFATLPPLFAVIHAAGIARDALLLRQSPDDWAEILQVNATGSFLVARAALEKLQPGGRLIFLSSRVGEHGNAGQVAYASSKAAVIALARVAAREGATRQLAVNVICPGLVPSMMTAALTPSQLEAAQAQSVLHTLGTVEQVVSTLQWLLSDDAAHISGQVIHCDSRI